MLKIGDKAPAFSLPDQNGVERSLKEFKGKKVVLYFYPKDMTPGCTIQACDFRDHAKEIKKHGAVVIGISKDSIERHVKFQEKYDLNFTLLADENAEVCKAYGVYKMKSLYGRKFLGIERTTFVISESGRIEKIFGKVKVKGHVQSVLTDL
ncbi:MAG: thioredoxin-dependent thiol peroxidase [Oligoflexia bacterium]|nr:thioredoxin-dependent thiol peroxidase [Oligoflexia bacterium]